MKNFQGVRKALLEAVVNTDLSILSGFLFVGEAFPVTEGKCRANKIVYDRCPKDGVIWYDVMTLDGNRVSESFRNTKLIQMMNLLNVGEKAPTLSVATEYDQVVSMLENTKSMLGGDIEGFVLKSDNLEQYIKVIHSKYAETKRHKIRMKSNSSNLADSYISDMLFAKHVTKLKELNKWNEVNVNANIGSLLKNISEDVFFENKEAITKALWKMFTKEYNVRLADFVKASLTRYKEENVD
jgi:hypothetical protein